LLLTALAATSFAESPPQTELDQFLHDGSILESAELKKEEARIKKEQRFSRLREMRRDTLEAIPKVKAELDALGNTVTALTTEQSKINSEQEEFDPNEIGIWEQRKTAIEARVESIKSRGKRSDQTDAQ